MMANQLLEKDDAILDFRKQIKDLNENSAVD